MTYLAGNKRNDVGLVLHIDPANIKCFRGEPTINYVTNLTGWGSSLTLMSEKLNGYPIYKNKVTNPNVGNNFGIHQPIYTNIPSNTSKITLSFWVRVITMPGNLYGYVSVKYTDTTTEYHSWSYSPNPFNNLTYVGKWLKVISTITTNVSKTPDSITNFYVYRDNALYGEMDISQVQIETKDHSTYFVNGTRGTTTATNGGLKDLSTSLNNATITNTLQYINNTMYFNGTSDVVLIPTSSSINFTGTDDYTMVAWVKPITGGVTWYGVFSKGNENSYAMNINSSTWYLQFEIYGTGSRSFNTTVNVITPNAWNFIVMLYNGVTQKIFVNGILLNSQSNILGTYGNTSDLRIGLGNDGEYFKGYMGDLRIYNRGLRDDEVVSMYNSSKSRYI